MKLAFKFDSGRIISHEVFERTFSIGRSESCRIPIESESFSREHCLIELVDEQIYVTDMGSKNGVFINHIRIPKKVRVALDQKLPLYVGECFITIDTSEDLKDPDHLSLETNSKIDSGDIYQPINPPRRIGSRPAPVSAVPGKKAFDKKGLMLVILIAVAIVGIHRYRVSIKARSLETEQAK